MLIIVRGTAYSGSGGSNRADDKVTEFSIFLIANVAVKKGEACSRFDTVRRTSEKCDSAPDFPSAEYKGVICASTGSIEQEFIYAPTEALYGTLGTAYVDI